MKTLKIALGLLLTFSLISSCGDDEEEETAADNFTLNGAGSGVTALLATPEAASLSVYQFAVSANEDCSDPLVVIDNGDTPVDFDMLASPEIGTGTIPDGTYPCVIFIMAPELSVTPGTTDSACTAGEAISQNVCAGGGGGDSEGATVDLEGNLQTCAESTDKAYLYLSTGSLLTNDYQSGDNDNCNSQENERACNSWEPPTATDSYLGIPLESALVVAGSQVGVLTLSNLNAGAEGDGDTCGLDRPNFTFTSGE